MSYIPQDDATRKAAPLFRGLLGYFPAALFEVAAHSLDSDLKHGAPPEDAPHWMRGKSTDHEDTIIRHLIDAGPRRARFHPRELFGGDPPKGSSAKDGRRYHLRCIAWRALALLQEDCEADGAAPGVSSIFPEPADKLRAAVEALRHPAEKLAIDAFRRETADLPLQVGTPPSLGRGHPGADAVFEQLQEKRQRDVFAALSGGKDSEP